MKIRLLLCLALAVPCRPSLAELAEVPLTGRWENLAFSPAEVNRLSRERYNDTLASYAAQRKLDDDPRIGRRVAAVAASLFAQAMAIKPSTKAWAWEVHTTSDPNIDAYCLAGGKLLIGSTFVKRMHLNDGELAMLIAHEVAHAVAEHHREELFEARRLDGRPGVTPAMLMAELDADLTLQFRLERLSNQQETEADQLGMIMANRAGWSSRDMVSFYRKLAAAETGSVFSGGYPPSSARLSMALGMAKLFETKRRGNDW